MTKVEDFNRQSFGEEIANAVSHGLGALLSIAGTAVLIVLAVWSGNVMSVVSASIYGFSLVTLYLMSTLYHSFTNKKIKKVFQLFDHCSVFLLILGSYVPICLSLLGGVRGWVLFGVNLTLTVLGIVLNIVNIRKYHKVSLFLYLAMGWSVMFALPTMLAVMSLLQWVLLVTGGLCYSIGVLFYKAEKPRYMHSVWHLFVLAGSILHYFFMLNILG